MCVSLWACVCVCVCVCLCVCVSAPNATKSAENKINLPDIEGTREGRLSIFSHGEPRFTFCPDQFSSHPSLSTLPILTTLLPPNHWVAYVANCLYYVSMSSHANQRSLLEEKHVWCADRLFILGFRCLGFFFFFFLCSDTLFPSWQRWYVPAVRGNRTRGLGICRNCQWEGELTGEKDEESTQKTWWRWETVGESIMEEMTIDKVGKRYYQCESTFFK